MFLGADLWLFVVCWIGEMKAIKPTGWFITGYSPPPLPITSPSSRIIHQDYSTSADIMINKHPQHADRALPEAP